MCCGGFLYSLKVAPAFVQQVESIMKGIGIRPNKEMVEKGERLDNVTTRKVHRDEDDGIF
jgi:hypothetical protein